MGEAIWGICVAAILTGLISYAIAKDTYWKGYQAETLIQECQQELPRNEHCVIIAVPEGE